MSGMGYNHRFVIQASHFNNAKAYEDYHQALEDRDFYLLHNLLAEGVHGHNFEILVQVEGILEGSVSDHSLNAYLIEDEALAVLIGSLDNTNLSIHPMFVTLPHVKVDYFPIYNRYRRKGNQKPQLQDHPRVTAELMCERLCDEVARLVTGTSRFSVTISVRETRDIKASLKRDYNRS